MREPDFFIVGAPKCGTTALREYLRSHRRIFMTAPKEPGHFCRDMGARRNGYPIAEEYYALFAGARRNHQAVGEASVHYLRSKTAISLIMDRHPDAKLIVMLRNPLTFLPSWHNQLLYGLMETESDFSRAWSLQKSRREGRDLPEGLVEPAFLLDYEEAAKFGDQTERLLNVAPRHQILFLRFEDFVADTRAQYMKTLQFLGVDDDGRTTFPRINASHAQRSTSIARLIRFHCVPFGLRVPCFAKRSGFRSLLGRIVSGMLRLNTRAARTTPLSAALADEIRETLREDILKTARLTGIDVHDWQREDPVAGEERADSRTEGYGQRI